jgi:hypothetical protein
LLCACRQIPVRLYQAKAFHAQIETLTIAHAHASLI